ncbi:MAG: helix-turn-helix domain-containing protein [Clostridiales bacterium]|jgi:hypothetical protein|nr:helix-turn-helix domain-containing protein [Clostridiales bacterium]
MDWMTTKEAAELWGVKVRQVQTLCERGLVTGAVKMSVVWLLPKSAVKPLDGRTRAGKQVKERS